MVLEKIMKQFIVIAFFWGHVAMASMPGVSSDESASYKILRLARERRKRIYNQYTPCAAIKRWCFFHEDVQKMIDDLKCYQKKDKQRVSKTILNLDIAFEFACQRTILDLTLISFKRNATFLEQLNTLNDTYENFYARTFPLQWKNIISRLTWANTIKQCVKDAIANNAGLSTTKK